MGIFVRDERDESNKRGNEMTRAAKVVVREKNGKYYAGFASELPLKSGYKDVSNYGDWYGIQMDYRPYNRARRNAALEADDRNRGNECIREGKTYVSGYRKDDGTWVRGHCRDRNE